MKRIYRKALLLAGCLALVMCGLAQEFVVKGSLADSASSKPVPTATINFHEMEKKISRTVVSIKRVFSNQPSAWQVPANDYA
jgi:uncharacterized membrane protein YqhA